MSRGPPTRIMHYQSALFFILFVVLESWVFLPLPALALGTLCTGPLGPGTATDPQSPYWLETIKKQGTSPFNKDANYKVFRNVKDYGAVGDGVTDDTDAINKAIADGDRCGLGKCDSSTLTPAVVYFPSGVYLVSAPVIAWYYTALVGDAKNPPTLLASPGFDGIAVIDADPYIPDGYGAQWYVNQNNFFRSFRNFIIDLRNVDPLREVTGLHWQVSQATSLTNVWIRMPSDPDIKHRGIFIENGSGGFMGDLVIEGGKMGMHVGNQQFTVRNVTIRDAVRGISFIWNWGWTFQGLKLTNCVEAGVYIRIFSDDDKDSPLTGGLVFVDVDIQNTPVFILTSSSTVSPNKIETGSLVLNNVRLINVPSAVQTDGGKIILAGGTRTIDHWIRGNHFEGLGKNKEFVEGKMPSVYKPASLLDSSGNIFGRTRPVYADYGLDQIVSVKDFGAKGDGETDDTAVLQAILDDYAGCKIIYFDAGTYIITDTLYIPPGSRIIGEIWTEVMGSGPTFYNMEQPKPVIRVGNPCSRDVLEISDMLFSTRGPAAGAIVVEWDAADPIGMQGMVGMWDSHIRLGATLGSQLGAPECTKQQPKSRHCFAAFLALHLTPASNGYFEGTWIWLGDHDLDNNHDQITVFSGRGLLSESKGPVWLIGTAEHHVLYQFNLVNAEDHYMGLVQTETPYYQPIPIPPVPYRVRQDWKDPEHYDNAAWSLRIVRSHNILIYGAGFYSFFQNYDSGCIKSTTKDCQRQTVTIDSVSSVTILNLATIGTTYQLTIDGAETVPASQNQNGFAAMLTSYTSSPKGQQIGNKNWYTEMVVFPTFDVDAGRFL